MKATISEGDLETTRVDHGGRIEPVKRVGTRQVRLVREGYLIVASPADGKGRPLLTAKIVERTRLLVRPGR